MSLIKLFYLRYKPAQVDIETKLKAFIPDYIPAVGEVDAFLKMPRPDNQNENLGLLVLVKNIIILKNLNFIQG